MTKKLLLIFALLCAFAQGAWAQNYDVWNGVTQTAPHASSSNTIEINTVAELAWLMYNFREVYTDISITSAVDNLFRGTFDGNGHTITANIYLPQDNNDYAIVYSDGLGAVPLNFEAKENGEFSLTVNPEGVDMLYLHLIDIMAYVDIDLLQTPTYTFTAKTSDYASRFPPCLRRPVIRRGRRGRPDLCFLL